ncbi:MAG: GNAT family N-acetyltransferase [Alphaproteobacteria bacterium]|nr:GNAT family N-acetyltransferase [Alphaproteobacteria bacterium]
MLRPARGEDVLPYTAFLADPDVAVWLDDTVQRPVPATRVEAILLHEAWSLWSIDCEGRFVGVASLYEPDLVLGAARFSIVLGDKRVWGKGLGTAITREVLHRAFSEQGLRKIKSDYLVPNVASKVLHERVGFVEEGRLRDDAWRRGEWVDRVLLSFLSREYGNTTDD